ncbi:MAG: PIG-L deacetylase family protein [Anaerolineales bacterium]|nr:PIG-L deacetylase family protein [Anaerolineales bacterium]
MRNTLLVILAHPDDESFPIGGTLAKYSAAGTRIVLICATYGEMGIEKKNPQQAAAVRKEELKCAADALGVDDLRFLGYPDGSLPEVAEEEMLSRLTAILQEVRPDALITFGPDGISGHPDHITISRRVTQAFDRTDPGGIRLFYIAPSEATRQGCGVDPPQEKGDWPIAGIDITEHRSAKVRAIQCHASQNPPFQGKLEQAAKDLACHEFFSLARPRGSYNDLVDLFGALVEDL